MLAFWATVLGQVVLPGVLLVRGARLCGSGDAWLLVGQGASVGLALQGIAMLLGRALGAPWLATLAALAVTGAGVALARRGQAAPETAAAAPPAASASTLLVALVAVLLQPLASTERLGDPVPFDLLLHAGTAGELRHRWPLQDPRVAGVPLHYHVLAYALPIEAADLAGAPLADSLLAIAPLFWVGLLALLAANAGRVVFKDARAGVLGAALALFHADPGHLLGLGAFAFNSHFATAVYGSPTTVVSFLLLLGLTLSLAGWLETRRRRELAVVALLAAAASGAKTTVVPVVVCGLALCAAWGALVAQERRVALLGVGRRRRRCAAAPFTLWQTLGASSYSRMAHFGALTAFASSGFAGQAAAWFGPDALAGVALLPLLLAWLVGFFGLAGLAAAFWLVRRDDRLSGAQAWALSVVGTAVVASLLVDAPGLSQLFLLYNGQLLLCLVAGAGLARAFPPRRARADVAWALLLLLAASPSAAMLARALPTMLASDLQSRARGAPDGGRVRAGTRLAADARQPRRRGLRRQPLAAALGRRRAAALLRDRPVHGAGWEMGPGREPWPERAALQERLLRRPDREALAEARRAVGSRARLLVVADFVQSKIESGFVFATPGRVPGRRLFPEELFELRFANAALHVYEARR